MRLHKITVKKLIKFKKVVERAYEQSKQFDDPQKAIAFEKGKMKK